MPPWYSRNVDGMNDLLLLHDDVNGHDGGDHDRDDGHDDPP